MGGGDPVSIREDGIDCRVKMIATWEIEFTADQLNMLAFCVENLSAMLREDLESSDPVLHECLHGTKKLSKTQLRRDIADANKILSAVYKGQVNLAVADEVKKSVTPRHGTQRRKKK